MSLLEISFQEVDQEAEQLPNHDKNEQEGDEANVLKEAARIVVHPVEPLVECWGFSERDTQDAEWVSGVEAHDFVQMLHERHGHLREVHINKWDVGHDLRCQNAVVQYLGWYGQY